MATTTRLEKAISGLNEIVQRNKKQDKYIFSRDKIIIDNSSPQVGAIVLLSLMLLLPLGLILYYYLAGKPNTTIFWLLLLEAILINDFYKLLQDNNKDFTPVS